MSRIEALVESHQARQDAQHQAGIDAADARADALDDYIDQAIDAGIDSADETDETLLPVLESDGPRQPMRALLAGMTADTLADWLRLVMRAPVADLELVALNMRVWMRDTLAESADVQAEAERLMAQDDADATYTAAQDRAELNAEWVRL